MAIKDVETKCYILALFIRNDGARFLLGSGNYEFKDSQQHFSANTMANDVVEVQGNDGYLLAGQVRRPGVQSFDGYVGDAGTSKPAVESLRRDFFQFFRKGYFYKVVYVFPDGSAIQRKRGFLVDAPVVQELYQIYPEYHVALNFEDVNYYYYDENAEGDEIYGKSAIIGSTMATGGLVWDEDGAVTDPLVFGGVVTVKGAETINNLLNVAVPLASVGLYGDTYQQTYSGKNLMQPYPGVNQGITTTVNADGSVHCSGTTNASWGFNIWTSSIQTGLPILPAGTYTLSIPDAIPFNIRLVAKTADDVSVAGDINLPAGSTSVSFTSSQEIAIYYPWCSGVPNGTVVDFTTKFQLEAGSTATDFEPYVGGIPSPNPDYPQEVQTVTGRQVVTISDGQGQGQEYEVNLGKNLWDMTGITVGSNATVTGPDADGAYTISWTGGFNAVLTPITNIAPSLTYTISFEHIGEALSLRRVGSGTSGSLVQTSSDDQYTKYSASVSGYDVLNLEFIRRTNTANVSASVKNFQIELGSTATSYAPYFPPIELCKIGEYQDYIYKNGDDWYVRKEVEKVTLDSTLNWEKSTNITTVNRYRSLSVRARAFNDTKVYCVSSHNVGINAIDSDAGKLGVSARYATNGGLFFATPIGLADTVADFNTWVEVNRPLVYYALATPTDTQITDTTLIGQLNALGTAKLYVGENNLLVTANGDNLPAELEVGYYTEIEDGAGFVWEEGSQPSGLINVDSIDSVFPRLIITGETINPVITNVTTGTLLRYNGTVTASQTLIIDMMAQTATLNGVSVIGNITGDWIYFDPGNNRVTYTATNADAPDATIEWQEIVG